MPGVIGIYAIRYRRCCCPNSVVTIGFAVPLCPLGGGHVDGGVGGVGGKGVGAGGFLKRIQYSLFQIIHRGGVKFISLGCDVTLCAGYIVGVGNPATIQPAPIRELRQPINPRLNAKSQIKSLQSFARRKVHQRT